MGTHSSYRRKKRDLGVTTWPDGRVTVNVRTTRVSLTRRAKKILMASFAQNISVRNLPSAHHTNVSTMVYGGRVIHVEVSVGTAGIDRTVIATQIAPARHRDKTYSP